jgi:hypothetical protein
MADPDDEYDDSDLSVPAELTGDARSAALLLEWARRRGFSVPALEVGSVKMRVTDLRPRYGRKSDADPDDPQNIYEEYGMPQDAR